MLNKKFLSSFVENQDFKIICILLLIILDLIGVLLGNNKNTYDYYIFFISILDYSIIILLLINQKRYLMFYNIDGLSILFLVLFNSATIYKSIIRFLLLIFVAIALFFWWKKCLKMGIITINSKQFLHLFLGIFVGLVIVITKTQLSNIDIFHPLFNQPGKYISCILLSLSRLLTFEEFIYRGFLFGLLKEMKINDFMTIIITSLLWSISHLGITSDPYFLLDIFISGVIFGFFVTKTKSLTVGIGAHLGYNSISTFIEFLK